MTLPTSVYSANRGYGWSQVPSGMTTAQLTALCRMVAESRDSFADGATVASGVVCDGEIAAIYTKQTVEHWDAESRSSDYLAMAFVPIAKAGEISFVDLLNQDFFWIPSHSPCTSIEYSGPSAERAEPQALMQLLKENRCALKNPNGVGTVIALCGRRSDCWKCRLKSDNSMEIICNSWRPEKEFDL